MSKNIVKTRFAPSPTGFLHIGSLRTALFAYLWAQKNNGSFLLRIEDTDKAREVEGSAEQIQNSLKEFGLMWDEGPYFQSQRLEIYKQYADELVGSGGAYVDDSDKEKGTVIRQKIPKGETVEFEDIVYGKIKIETDKLDEGVLIKSDGYPTYNFAHIIDDHLMGITHVMRGEEFIPSMPKYILLYRAFGWKPPEFAHLPLILDKNRKKLSKRTGDVAVEEYLKQGYLKEALLNFIALLGWNPKSTDEIFSLDELIEEFDLKKINRAGAIFDIEKLNFINREWQKRLSLGEKDPLYQRALKHLEEKFETSTPSSSPPYQGGESAVRPGEGMQAGVWPLILERVKGPSDLEEKLPEFYFFFEEPEYETELLIWKNTEKNETQAALRRSFKIISNFPPSGGSPEGRQFPISKQDVEKIFLQEIGEGDKGKMLWPMRVALTGLKNSPSPFEIISVFSRLKSGKEIVCDRIQKAIDKMS